jgi:hypothetical protein
MSHVTRATEPLVFVIVRHRELGNFGSWIELTSGLPRLGKYTSCSLTIERSFYIVRSFYEEPCAISSLSTGQSHQDAR